MMDLERMYVGEGISFRYPEGWHLAEEPNEEAPTVTVSDGAAFWSVTLMKQRPPAEQVIQEATHAFQEEYDEMDVETLPEVSIGGRRALACDLEFICMELVNCVSLRAFRTGRFTLFIMYQYTDHERELYAEAFRGICHSLECDFEDDVLVG